MTSEFRVQLDITNDVGQLSWQQQEVSPETLYQAVSLAAANALQEHQLRRLQVNVLAPDRNARVALHRAGFRLEGRLRQVQRQPSGELVDGLIYSRLASDAVHGAEGFSGVMDSVLPMKRTIAHAVLGTSRAECC